VPEDQQKEPSELGRGPLVDVAQALSDVARSLEAEPDLQRVVEGIVAAVTETVPGAEQAGVSLREGGILRTVAATGDLARRLNAIEHELDEGPCVQAVVEHRSYRIDDMSTDTRWPRFAAAAQAHGARSMLGYRLFTSGRTLGALDLYSSKLDAFNAESEVVGELFAAHAAIALIGSTQQAGQAHLRALGGQELAEAVQSARHPKGWHWTAYPVSSDGDRTLGSPDWFSVSIRRCAVSSALS
jgi:GAF domain-containing protein